jgi:dihydrofolate reductase
MKPAINLIAGVARNGAIGRDNQLLWRLPEDMARFKALTMGHPVIMGRKTWDSLPARFRPLPGRRNLVLSRAPGLQLLGAEVCTSLNAAIARCAQAERVFVIGGAQIYAEALPLAERLELTEIDADFAADCFFPPWERTKFNELGRESRLSPPLDNQPGWRYDFVSYQRKQEKKEDPNV